MHKEMLIIIIIIAASQVKNLKERAIQTLNRLISELDLEHKYQFHFVPSVVTHIYTVLRATRHVASMFCAL